MDKSPTLTHAVISGATSGIITEVLRIRMERSPMRLSLIGRDPGRLKVVASDLQVRSPASQISTYVVDFLDAASVSKLIIKIADLQPIDMAMVAQGQLPNQATCETDLVACEAAISLNATSAALFAMAFAQIMDQQGYGQLVILGSVAGDRGRQSNYVYGATKAMLAKLAQGLQHRFAGSPIHILLIKPGPTDTAMTADFKSQGMKLASAHDVARGILKAMDHKKPVAYVPGHWAIIMLIIVHIPRWIFNKIRI